MKHGQRKEVKRGNTAIKRTSHSVPYRAHIKAGRLQGRILDYGCGRGYAVAALRAQGLDIHGFDKFQPAWSDRPAGEFDVVTCNYVLNVIEDPAERQQVIQELKTLGRDVYITVRSDLKSIKDSWEPMADGYYTSGKTFQKIYTADMVREEFGPVEILMANSTGIMFRV